MFFVEERRWLDRKAHVVEAHLLDERDVARGGVRAQVRLRVVAPRRLREPVAQVHSAPKTGGPRPRDAQRVFIITRVLRAGLWRNNCAARARRRDRRGERREREEE